MANTSSATDVDSHKTEREGVRVVRADGDDLARWDDLIASSPQGTPLHRLASLRVLANQSQMALHPLVGYKGQEPVGVFPIFVHARAGVRAAFSPPPHLYVPYLGPALCNFDGLKQRRSEKRHRRFVDASLAWIDDVVSPRYVHVRTVPAYPDPRPFAWDDFDVTPRHTYRVDLTLGTETLLQRFSSDARRNVDVESDGVSVGVGEREHVAAILEQVRDRYAEQGKQFGVPAEFVTTLYDRAAGDAVRPYVCTLDGEFVGGVLTLRDDDAVYAWHGGVKLDLDFPVNDILDWRVMRDAIDDGHRTYDLVGANNPRLCEYKSKFAPDLVEYYSLERAGLATKAAVEAYQRYRQL